MITERDLNEAIAECEGQRNPKSGTCIKLAAFYTLKEHLFPESVQSAASYQSRGESSSGAYHDSGESREDVITYSSPSEFAGLINGKPSGAVWPIMDELMDALIAVNPRLYQFAIRRLRQV